MIKEKITKYTAGLKKIILDPKKDNPAEEGVVYFNSGLPLPELVAAAATIATGLYSLVRSIKRVPPGYVGVRITTDRLSSEELPPGWHLTDPFRTIQKIAVVDMRPAEVTFEGIGKGLLGDGTIVSGDVSLTVQALSAFDILNKIELGPRVSLRPGENGYSRGVGHFLNGTVGNAADYATTEAATTVPNIEALTNPGMVQTLRVNLIRRTQDRIDEVFYGDEPELLRRLKELTQQGQRLSARRGIGVVNASIAKFTPSDEVIESMQEGIGAPFRAQAERTFINAVGESYAGKYLNARAARESSENGATTVVHLGPSGNESAAASAVLGMANKDHNGHDARRARHEARKNGGTTGNDVSK